MRNETVETVYGSVEVDTVECDSCGDTILRDGAYRFGMSTNTHKKINHSKYNGYACEHCADVGPASFPGQEVSSDEDKMPILAALMLIVLYPFLAPFVSLVCIVDRPFKDDVVSGYMYSFLATIFWGGLLTYLFIL